MPKEYTFNEIFNLVIDETKKSSVNVRAADKFCDMLQRQKREICEIYLALRNRIKNRYMSDDRNLLDRHKCAASFMVAFIHAFNVTGRNFCKERLTISVGILLLTLFIREECKNIGDMGLIDYIDKNGGLVFPPCICDGGDYVQNWTTEMYCARHEKMMFALSMSNILFMIETYNRQQAKIDALEAVNR